MSNFVMDEKASFVRGYGFVEGNLAVILHEEFSPKPAMMYVYDIETADSLTHFIALSKADSKGRYFNANVRRLPVLTQKPVILH